MVFSAVVKAAVLYLWGNGVRWVGVTEVGEGCDLER